jgi:hypothetical protein
MVRDIAAFSHLHIASCYEDSEDSEDSNSEKMKGPLSLLQLRVAMNLWKPRSRPG